MVEVTHMFLQCRSLLFMHSSMGSKSMKMVLASGWVLACSVITHFLYSDSIMEKQSRRNGNRQNGSR